MCYAESEGIFRSAYDSACEELKGESLEYFQKFGNSPEKISTYKIRSYPGNLFRHGSSLAEQNHSSFVQRIGKCLLTEPHETVLCFMQRQSDIIINEKNSALHKYYRDSLIPAKGMADTDPRKEAKQQLSSWGYELYEESCTLSRS